MMSFQWEDYLEIAQGLACPANEALQRAAISRAYYAAFCSARNWLVANGAIISTLGTAHGEVKNAFSSPGLTREKYKIGTSLGRMRRNRNMADYADHVPNLTLLVTETLNDASEVIRLLKTI